MCHEIRAVSSVPPSVSPPVFVPEAGVDAGLWHDVAMTNDDIRSLLLQRAETPNLDYKAGFAWTKENRDLKYELVRDLIAMANTEDGGCIIFSVRDNDLDFVGVDDA